MSLPPVNVPESDRRQGPSGYDENKPSSSKRNAPSPDVTLIDQDDRVHDGRDAARANVEQPEETASSRPESIITDDEDERPTHRPVRGRSYSREFPTIPALEFESEGDTLDPDKPKLRIRAVTWNVGGYHPKEDLTELLGLMPLKKRTDVKRKNTVLTDDEQTQSDNDSSTETNNEREADLIFVGFQELSANPMAPVMETVISAEIWQSTLKRRLSAQDYVLLQSIRLQGIILVAFCKSKHLRQIRSLETSYVRTGASGWWGNKGAVGISFEAYGVNMCVVNCHLTAHDHGFDDRVRNYHNILADLIFPRRGEVSTILDHDYVIWMGDMNFRIEGITQDKALYYINSQNWPKLLKHDQLRRAAFVKGAFSTFREGKIQFPPTYKFVEGNKAIYDMRNSAKIRRPSYCDRILWRGLNRERKIHLVEYKSHMDYKISDHKPVSCVLQISLGEAKEQFITFDPIERWYVGENGRFFYSAKPGVYYSNWDWIGLYKVDHYSFDDYVTYVWSPGGRPENSGVFNGRYLAKPGRYLLIYFSSEHKCGIGYSEPFEIVERSR